LSEPPKSDVGCKLHSVAHFWREKQRKGGIITNTHVQPNCGGGLRGVKICAVHEKQKRVAHEECKI